MADVKNALEIGGGMGYLMRDFLSLNPRLCAKMIDISPYLLQKQKDTLKSLEVDFELADILTVPQQENFLLRPRRSQRKSRGHAHTGGDGRRSSGRSKYS